MQTFKTRQIYCVISYIKNQADRKTPLFTSEAIFCTFGNFSTRIFHRLTSGFLLRLKWNKLSKKCQTRDPESFRKYINFKLYI